MKDKLVVHTLSRHDDRYRLAWWIAEDGDIGGTLGDPKHSKSELNESKGEDRVVTVSCFAARETEEVQHDNRGYYWPSPKLANQALRQIKLAVKNDGGAPWPDWAMKAHAAGWKAPKGWRP